ncbi:hypothetical protein EYF80_015439 [Liparis tanakae]|uniref:Uncharacterized protein n=1 Tax=Liparis tanakae TaxID=230148 RepID=A0A4Z2I8K3_9TELE|nr:hypothetical protein EYF80_015439 [Liparis tanakae]
MHYIKALTHLQGTERIRDRAFEGVKENIRVVFWDRPAPSCVLLCLWAAQALQEQPAESAPRLSTDQEERKQDKEEFIGTLLELAELGQTRVYCQSSARDDLRQTTWLPARVGQLMLPSFDYFRQPADTAGQKIMSGPGTLHKAEETALTKHLLAELQPHSLSTAASSPTQLTSVHSLTCGAPSRTTLAKVIAGTTTPLKFAESTVNSQQSTVHRHLWTVDYVRDLFKAATTILRTENCLIQWLSYTEESREAEVLQSPALGGARCELHTSQQ